MSFLEFLSHGITIAIRAIVSDSDLTSKQKLDQVYWLNEVHHRVPMRSRSFRRGEPEWIGPDLGLNLQQYASEKHKAAELLDQAIEMSIEFVNNESSPKTT